MMQFSSAMTPSIVPPLSREIDLTRGRLRQQYRGQEKQGADVNAAAGTIHDEWSPFSA
jgi:hypothetical protein